MTRKQIARVCLTAAALLLAVPAATAGSIMNSAHDFTAYNWSGGEVCVACHSPQNSGSMSMTTTAPPQWNHTITAASYTLYSSTSLKANISQPGPKSKICLSCHDGTVAVDSFGGTVGSGNSQNISSANNVGTSLKDDHPISFAYNTALATDNGSLFDPSSKTVTIGSGTTTKSGSIASLMLYDGQMECSSCHDVHNKYTVGTTGLLKVASASSAICTACHKK